MTKKKEQNEVPVPDLQENQPDTGELLREIAKDKKRIRELNNAKSRIDRALKAVRLQIAERESIIYEPYESTEPVPVEETLKQLELF